MESLEGRQLLANSALGYSIPDLSVTGTAGPVAAWGGSLSVTATLVNTGASTQNDPLALAPGSTSTADVAGSTVFVYLSPHPHSLAGSYQLGTLSAPALAQNTTEQVSTTFNLPNRPIGFPRAGGKFYVSFLANPDNSIVEVNHRNNLSQTVAVKVVPNYLPLLEATALDVPDTMQPGDTIQPSFSIANLGTADTALQGNVQVALVASVDPNFTLGSSIVAIYNIGNISSLSHTPTKSYYRTGKIDIKRATLNNLSPNNNISSITGTPVTLPTSPSTYYLGLVIDPYNKIAQLPHSGNRFQLIKAVGPATSGLPAAGVINTGGGTNTQPFPVLPSGASVGINANAT